MSENYGVTPTGFVKKRLDVITEELQENLGKAFGFDLKSNPKSYLNVLVTNFSDKIAELWEVADETYQNLYPSTAENESLDRVAQFGGCYREYPQSSVYTILCKGDNGTKLPAGTRVQTSTNPPIMLMAMSEGAISIDNCCELEIEVLGKLVLETENSNGLYWIKIDEKQKISVRAISDEETLMEDFAAEIIDRLSNDEYVSDDTLKKWTDGNAEISDYIYVNDSKLHIIFPDYVAHTVEISPYLNPVDVVSPNLFETEELSNIQIPEGGVNEIYSSVSGLKEVYSLADYVAGRARETDAELRQSYLEKIFIRSRTMLQSITSALLQNVRGVESVIAYQNDTHVWRGVPKESDIKHMPPHSVEVIVVGGDDEEIAKQIFATKAAGIQTCHHCGHNLRYLQEYDDSEVTAESGYKNLDPESLSKLVELAKTTEEVDGVETVISDRYCREIDVEDEYGNVTSVKFSRPWEVKFDVEITITPNIKEYPGVELFNDVKRLVAECINSLTPGEDVQPQQWVHKLYEQIPGIAHYKFAFTAQEEIFSDIYTPDGEVESVLNIQYKDVARVDVEDIVVKDINSPEESQGG